MADGGNWGWIGTAIATITAVITGGTALNSTYQKVKTHDRVLFKERGGMNVVSEEACKVYRGDCHTLFTAEIKEIVRDEFKKYREQDKTDLILKELKKINSKEG